MLGLPAVAMVGILRSDGYIEQAGGRKNADRFRGTAKDKESSSGPQQPVPCLRDKQLEYL